MVDGKSRKQIQEELCKRAADIIATSDSKLKETSRDDSRGKVVRAATIDHHAVVHIVLSVDEVTPSQFKAFCADYFNNISKCVPEEMKITKLDDDEGHTCVWQRMVPGGMTGMVVSPRSMFVTYYPMLDSGDDVIMMASS